MIAVDNLFLGVPDSLPGPDSPGKVRSFVLTDPLYLAKITPPAGKASAQAGLQTRFHKSFLRSNVPFPASCRGACSVLAGHWSTSFSAIGFSAIGHHCFIPSRISNLSADSQPKLRADLPQPGARCLNCLCLLTFLLPKCVMATEFISKPESPRPAATPAATAGICEVLGVAMR